MKAAAKADISDLSDSLLLHYDYYDDKSMAAALKKHDAAEKHPTPSPTSSSPHPVPGHLTAPAAGSSTPPPPPQQPRCWRVSA